MDLLVYTIEGGFMQTYLVARVVALYMANSLALALAGMLYG